MRCTLASDLPGNLLAKVQRNVRSQTEEIKFRGSLADARTLLLLLEDCVLLRFGLDMRSAILHSQYDISTAATSA